MQPSRVEGLPEEAVEARLDEGAGQLAGAVGTEVHEHHGVAVFHAYLLADARGLDELVALAALVVVSMLAAPIIGGVAAPTEAAGIRSPTGSSSCGNTVTWHSHGCALRFASSTASR